MWPNYILGDFDSISDKSQVYYRSNGPPDIQFIKMEDQDSTDLEKALLYSLELLGQSSKRVLVHGAFGGRIDHTMNAVHILHKFYLRGHFKAERQDELLLFDEYSKMMYVQPNLQYSIKLSSELDRRDGIGIIPIQSQ